MATNIIFLYKGELPVFTPPVVVNRPPQSLIDLHSQVNAYYRTNIILIF